MRGKLAENKSLSENICFAFYLNLSHTVASEIMETLGLSTFAVTDRFIALAADNQLTSTYPH